MSRGINKVIIVGNLGNDPEAKHMPNGGAVTNISVATSESWKDKTTGAQQERTEWHRVVFFNRLGEIAAQYLRKGSKVYIEGQLRTRKWQAQDGSDRYTTEIVGDQMQMLDNKNESNAQPQQQPPYQQQPQQAPQTPYQQPQQQPPRSNTNGTQQSPYSVQQAPSSFDDDIPF